jgi:predicted Zn-dependent protease
MGITDKMWDAVTTVIRMNDKVERMAGVIKDQQSRIENLTERVIRLETVLEVALASKALRTPTVKRAQIEGN